MNEIVLNVIFVGLIAHVPIGPKYAALLLNAPDHQQRLLVCADKVVYAEGFKELARQKNACDTNGQVTDMRVFSISGKWLAVEEERRSSKQPSKDYDDHIPHLKKISGSSELRREIKRGEWHSSVKSRLFSYSNERYITSLFRERVHFGDPKSAQCVPRAVGLVIRADDNENNELTLRSGANVLILRNNTDVIITNLPSDDAAHPHFEMHGDITYGQVSNPVEVDECLQGETSREAVRKGSTNVMTNTDVRCSNTNWP